MNHLIIYAHPSDKSLNATIKNNLTEMLKSEHDVQIRDLHQLNFNPVLSAQDLTDQRRGVVAKEVKTEQQLIEWADCLTFIYPIWWAGMPAMMKGYIDRVFSYGFAYRYVEGKQQGLLSDKKVVVINTQGKSAQEYQASGMDKAIALTSDFGIFQYCGMKVIAHLNFERADRATAEQIEVLQSAIKDIYQESVLLLSLQE
ncbi:NAD(P)H dehydrogenase (quinone) [Vibrio xiamenensis]|uniref:NAD(P)H dehydrogenase (Quinone) n=1 Tax=Vibrio xiamenensis TaxID=861298 RepID=A0A1G8GE82_9VIBR|nr:NAD(P)H-dependent oxidoreductase [Vibrio xiamenensis]SDH92597.1 NAD(P)H dehydrogenase (quinone) [Vibrio xiamenensis]